jgi:hypothetical protein
MSTMRILQTTGILLVLAMLVSCKPAASKTVPLAVSPIPTETRKLSSPAPVPTETLMPPSPTSLLATDSPLPPTVTPPPSFALEMGDAEVRNEIGGYALRYPEGWQIADLGGETFVFENEDAFDTLSVPIIWVKGGSLETLTDGDMAGAQNAQEMIRVLADRNRRQGENVEFGQVQAGNVAGERSASVNFSRSDEGLLLAGRLVAIHLDERGILIMGTGTVETWEPFIPTFEAVLASMTLFEPVPVPAIDVDSVLADTPTPESFSQASP